MRKISICKFLPDFTIVTVVFSSSNLCCGFSVFPPFYVPRLAKEVISHPA